MDNYDATFTFVPADVSPGADTGRFDVRKWDGSAWAETDDGVPPTATSTTATGLSSFSDFVIGESQASRMMVTLPGQTFTSGVGNSGAVSPQTAGAPFTLTLSAVGTFTNVDTSYSGLKTIRLSGPTNAPNGSSPVYTYSVEFVSGQASITSVAFLKAETVTVSASDGLLTPVLSASLTVAPAAASQLAFLNEAHTLTAGQTSAALTVQRQDPYGNPNTADATRTVTLTSDSAGATFAPASPVSITTGASSVSFTYTDTKAGRPTVTASSSSPAMSAAQQQTVAPGAVSATTSTFTASPSSVTADGVAASTLTVTLKDAYGNPVPDKSVSIVKKTGAGAPVITAVKNITGTDGQGIGTVKSVTAATDVFEARDTTDDIVVSQQASVTFTAGAVHHYKVTFSAAPYYALTPFTTRITAHDANDNFVADDTGTVFTLSSSSTNTVWDKSGDNVFSKDPADISTATANGLATIPTKCLNPDGAKGLLITASNTVTHLTYTSAPIDIDVAADAYRTRSGGLWSDAGTWERYDSGAWVAATLAPSHTNGVIAILPEHVVTVAGDVLVDQLHIEQGGQLTVAGGAVLTVTNASLPGLEVYGSLVSTGTLNVAVCSNSVVVYDSGVLANAGSVSSCSNALVFYGGTYRHLHSTTAGTIPPATWRANSQPATCAVVGYTSNTDTPGGLGQVFQQFVWNCPEQTGAISLGSGFASVETLDISSTGAGRVSLATHLAVSNTVTVSGGSTLYCGANVVTASRFDLNAGCTLGIGSPDGITTNGTTGNIRTLTRRFSSGADYVFNGASAQTTGDAMPTRVHRLTIDNAAGVALSHDLTVNVELTLANGALAIGAHALTLANAIATVNGTLAGGVSSSLHIVDVGGAENLELPAVADGLQSLTLARGTGATLTGAVTVWNTLTLTNGVLSGCGYLTLGDDCHIIRGSGAFYGPGLPTLLGLLNVTYQIGDLSAGNAFPPAVSNHIKNVTLANTSGTITLSYDFIIQGCLTVNQGARFNDNGHSLTVYGSVTNSGTYVSSGGRLVLSNGSAQHVIAGGGIYDNLELNDPLGATLAAAVTVSNRLTLTAGTLANSVNLTLGSGAELQRAAGALDAAPTFGTTVNVTYFGTTSVTTGFELPVADGTLVNLTLSHSGIATVTLDGNRTVNGDLTIGSHSALADNGFLLGVYNDVRNDGAHSGLGDIRLLNPSSQVLYGSGRYGNLVLLSGSAYLAGDPTIDGLLTINLMRDLSSYAFVVGAHTLTLNGPTIAATPTDLVTSLESSLVFGGSASGVVIPSSVQQLNNLTINNPNGVTMENTLRTVGTLTLTSGTLNTGTNILHHNNADNGSVVRAQGWVNGGLCKLFEAGAGQAFTFPVGSAAAYRPVVWSNLDVLSGGEMEMLSVEGFPASIAGSGLDSNRVAKAYWRGYAKGRYQMVNGVGAFTVASGDVPAGADVSRFNLRVWASALSAWQDVSVDSRTANAVVGADLYSGAQPSEVRLEYGDFVIGESLASRMLVTLPGETYTNSISQGNGNFGTVDSQEAGTSFGLELRAVDSFNAVDPSYSGVKTINTDGPADAPAGAEPVYTKQVTFTDGRATGVATTLMKAETTTLAASDGVLTGVPSSALTVNAAAATRLEFASAPVTVNAGYFSDPLAVRRVDAYGNVNTTDATLTLSLSSASAGTVVFGPASPQIEAGAGSVVFQYKDSQTGTWKLTAGGGALTAAEQDVTVVDAAALVWDGGGADNSVLTPGNWLGDASPREGDKLIFAGSARLAVTNDAPPYSVIGGLSFTNGAGAFVLEGELFGLAGNVVDASTAQQTINLPFFLGAPSAFDVNADGLLVVNREISGDYALTKAGAGRLNLTAANFYSGGTVVDAGTLLVNNISGSGTGSGDLTVNSGGTLGGGGFISGAVTVKSGGTLAPGNSPGTITFYTDLTLEAGSTYAVEIAGSSNDLAVVEGTASLGGATLSVSGTNPTVASYTIISAASITGQFAGLAEGAVVWVADKLYYIHYGSTEVTLNLAAVITGYVFLDKGTLDGIMNTGDAYLPGAEVRLYVNGAESPFATCTTGKYGLYSFQGVPPGDVQLKVALDGGILTTVPEGIDPMRNRAVSDTADAVVSYTAAAGEGVLEAVPGTTLNIGFTSSPLSTALDLNVYATAGGVRIELTTVNESGCDDIVVYAWIGGAWVEVGRVPSAEVKGEGSNRYVLSASGLSVGESYTFKVVDESGHAHVTAQPVAVKGIRVSAVSLALQELSLTFNTEYGKRYAVEVSADLVNWSVEYAKWQTDTGWSDYTKEPFMAGPGTQTQVRVPAAARRQAFFRIVEAN